MKWQLVVDPLFRVPFLNGLLLAVSMPLLGAYVRLRDEWLASLGMAQVTAAGGVVGMLLGIHPIAGALGAAGLAATAKGRSDVGKRRLRPPPPLRLVGRPPRRREQRAGRGGEPRAARRAALLHVGGAPRRRRRAARHRLGLLLPWISRSSSSSGSSPTTSRRTERTRSASTSPSTSWSRSRGPRDAVGGRHGVVRVVFVPPWPPSRGRTAGGAPSRGRPPSRSSPTSSRSRRRSASTSRSGRVLVTALLLTGLVRLLPEARGRA